MIINGQSKDEPILVPCGKCPMCIRRRSREWAFRITQESKQYLHSYFVTLTYANEHLPVTANRFATLEPDHLQLALKRFRYYDGSKNVKYYAVGEYGTRFHRPHYHICLMGVNDINNIHKAWKFGHVHVGFLNEASAAYATKYMHKEHNRKTFRKDDRKKEFSRMSVGLGQCFLSDSMKAYYKSNFRNLKAKYGTFDIPIPRYYRNQLWNDAEKALQVQYIKEEILKAEEKDRIRIQRLYGNLLSYKDWKQLQIEYTYYHNLKYFRNEKNFF